MKIKNKVTQNRDALLKHTWEFDDKVEIKICTLYFRSDAPVYWEVSYRKGASYIPYFYKTDNSNGKLVMCNIEKPMFIKTNRIRALAESLRPVGGKILQLGVCVKDKAGKVYDLDMMPIE